MKRNSLALTLLYAILVVSAIAQAFTIPPRTLGIPVLGQAATSGSHAWAAGLYGTSSGQSICCNQSGAGSVSEIQTYLEPNLTSAGGRWTGYAVRVYWTAFESQTASNYLFQGCTPPAYTSCGTSSALDQIFNEVRSHGGHVILLYNLSGFGGSHTEPGIGDDFVIPAYITNDNPGTGGGNCPNYGLGNSGGAFSTNGSCGWFYNAEQSNAVSNITNTGVYNRLTAMFANFCSKADGDPAFEGIDFETTDTTYPYGGTGLQGSTWVTAMQNLLLSVRASCPHSNVIQEVGFFQPSFDVATFTDWAVKHQIWPSGSDFYGGSAWSDFLPDSGRACVQRPNALNFATVPPLTGAHSENWVSTPDSSANQWACTGSPQIGGTYFLQFKLPSSGATLNNVTQVNNATSFSYSSTTGSPNGGDNYAKFDSAPWLINAGLQAWLGMSPGSGTYTPPNPSLQSYGTAWEDVQPGDMCGGSPGIPGVGDFFTNYNPDDIVAGANATGINGYNGSHVMITIMPAGLCTANPHAIWGNASTNPSVIYDINHLPLPVLVNTARPPGY